MWKEEARGSELGSVCCGGEFTWGAGRHGRGLLGWSAGGVSAGTACGVPRGPLALQRHRYLLLWPGPGTAATRGKERERHTAEVAPEEEGVCARHPPFSLPMLSAARSIMEHASAPRRIPFIPAEQPKTGKDTSFPSVSKHSVSLDAFCKKTKNKQNLGFLRGGKGTGREIVCEKSTRDESRRHASGQVTRVTTTREVLYTEIDVVSHPPPGDFRRGERGTVLRGAVPFSPLVSNFQSNGYMPLSDNTTSIDC